MGASGRLAIEGTFNGKKGWFYLHHKAFHWWVFMEGVTSKKKVKVMDMPHNPTHIKELALDGEGAITDVKIVIDLVKHERVK